MYPRFNHMNPHIYMEQTPTFRGLSLSSSSKSDVVCEFELCLVIVATVDNL
jgi:hypothetical protein